jgi:hypothetical protein
MEKLSDSRGISVLSPLNLMGRINSDSAQAFFFFAVETFKAQKWLPPFFSLFV